jgi:hypothetical protein
LFHVLHVIRKFPDSPEDHFNAPHLLSSFLDGLCHSLDMAVNAVINDE